MKRRKHRYKMTAAHRKAISEGLKRHHRKHKKRSKSPYSKGYYAKAYGYSRRKTTLNPFGPF